MGYNFSKHKEKLLIFFECFLNTLFAVMSM